LRHRAAPAAGCGLAAALAVAAHAAAGDPARGARVFQRCYACHSLELAETGLEGPNLNGILGRPAGAVPSFPYSEAFLARARSGLTWTEANLDAFLADPQGFIPGNAMGFFGLRDAQARADLIAYVKAAPAAP
jgi:cytochrome c